MIKAILCDRDGVLLDSEIVNIQSSLEALHALGITTHPSDEDIIMGRHPLDYVNAFVEKYAIDRERFLAIRSQLYTTFLRDVLVFQDTIDFIMHEKQSYALHTALVTSANRDTTMMVLEQHDLVHLFDVVVTFEDCDARKPDPQPYLVAAQKIHVDPKDCIVIEDSPVGVRAAKSAGMTCIVRLNDKNKNLDFHEADFVVHHLHDAKDFFDALCKK